MFYIVEGTAEKESNGWSQSLLKRRTFLSSTAALPSPAAPPPVPLLAYLSRVAKGAASTAGHADT